MKRRSFIESWCSVRAESLAHLAWVPPEERAAFADTQLRRLLFFQFLQTTAYLPGSGEFLRDRLARAHQYGADRFYPDVLLPLALVAPAYPPGQRGAVEAQLTGVPYFNAALFTPHPAEAAHGIHAAAATSGRQFRVILANSLFERWLEFLSAWRFSLDERSDHGVTPAVLGVLCEQGAARKREGVYYTGADITGYLCERTIVPRVLANVYGPDHPVFTLPAVTEQYIPTRLREPELLPLETEPERAARRSRISKLRHTPLHALEDWITLNLDLPYRALEIIRAERDAGRTHALYTALTRLTVLDPTCGSGAFLLASMETLEPLYAACIEAMRSHLGRGHLAAEVRLHFEKIVGSALSPWFARQEILARNLHGVDLMTAAVETTAVRLALGVLAAPPASDLALLQPDLHSQLQAGDFLAGEWSPEDLGDDAGYDVVVGNPPYVDNPQGAAAALRSRWMTAECPSRYAQVVERSLALLRPRGWLGMILPVSAVSGEEYRPLMELLRRRDLWISTFSNRPAKLFPGVEQRLATVLAGPYSPQSHVRATAYHHWYEVERPLLFSRLQYADASLWHRTGMPVKSGSAAAEAVWGKLCAQRERLGDWVGVGKGEVWLHDGPTYWVRALASHPDPDGTGPAGSHYRRIGAAAGDRPQALAALLSSSLFYFFFKLISNCRDLGHKEWAEFPIPSLSDTQVAELASLGARLARRLQETASVRRRQYPSGTVTYREYYPARAVEIIDEIDAVLARLYALTPEELEHVRQRDRKYRLGRVTQRSGEDNSGGGRCTGECAGEG